jgi:hypothetical protein
MVAGNGMAKVPASTGSCPPLTGLAGATVTIAGQTALIWSGTMGTDPAPLLFYWHGTGLTAIEAQSTMSTQITEITGKGGLAASFVSTTGTGSCTSGTCIFYDGDYATADAILACATQQLNIDTNRIVSAGCSAGGLQTGAMLYYRSSYLSCAMPNSGGVSFPYMMQDSHVGSVITTHGAPGADVVVIDFSQSSATMDNDIKSKGGIVVDCNHGGGHCGAPPDDIAAQWKFCMDHPFGIMSDPYMGHMPAGSPSYCVYP